MSCSLSQPALRRDLGTLLVFIGQLLGVLISIIIKKAVADPRPEGAILQDEGMPSNHVSQLFSLSLSLIFASFCFLLPFVEAQNLKS